MLANDNRLFSSLLCFILFEYGLQMIHVYFKSNITDKSFDK